jgi:hypothetical protein
VQDQIAQGVTAIVPIGLVVGVVPPGYHEQSHAQHRQDCQRRRSIHRLRTNFRKETVYLYRLTAPPVIVREVLLDYLKSVNRLNERPEWYNALTENCTTAIRGHATPYTHGKMSWKILANGYLDTLLYERKAIDTDMPFEQIKQISRINDKAVPAGDSSAFSTVIRNGLPNPHYRQR